MTPLHQHYSLTYIIPGSGAWVRETYWTFNNVLDRIKALDIEYFTVFDTKGDVPIMIYSQQELVR